jgi:maltooligosyltrehalose trehalohydrolase
MHREGVDGWWATDQPVTGRYLFVVDGTAIPDPRSGQQPEGIDGWSEVVDHSLFEWTDQDWAGFALPDAVVYELHVGTFTPQGTFAGVIGKLDHLIDLGVNTVEVMPVATFPGGHGWGYDGVGLYAPQWSYGGSRGFKELVDACHGHGISVVLDVVYNHLGPAGNHLHQLGPYFTSEHHTPWGDAINFDGAGSTEVRRFVIDNALHWVVDHHLDGLRLDAVHAIIDESPVHILQDIGTAVHEAGATRGRITWVIAESDLNDPRLVRDVGDGGLGLDAAWSDDFHHALHVALTGERRGYYADFSGLRDLTTALNDVFVYSGQVAPSRGRAHGQPVGDVDRNRFIGFSQNHDQIGNRAFGDRLAHLVGLGRQQIAAALVITAPFVPMLFQGEEWGSSAPFLYFTDHEDPDLAEAVRNGRKAEFAGLVGDQDGEGIPDPQDPDTLSRSVLDWAESTRHQHHRLQIWYRDLLDLRAAEPDLRSGAPAATTARCDEHTGWLIVERGRVVVVVNLGDDQIIDLAAANTGTVSMLLTNDSACTVAGGRLHLAADSVALLSR